MSQRNTLEPRDAYTAQSKTLSIRDAFRKLESFKVDPHLIVRVFSNLILNAMQAMPNGGTLTIRGVVDDDSVVIHRG